jgi:hypothetical protein
MTEILRKMVVTALVWLLVFTPMHTVMASVSVLTGDAHVGHVKHDIASPSSHLQAHQQTLDGHYRNHNTHHQADVVSSNTHCQQDRGCNGCDTCSHCMTAICSVVQFSVPSAQNGFASPLVFSYQVDLSATFRPPRHS